MTTGDGAAGKITAVGFCSLMARGSCLGLSQATCRTTWFFHEACVDQSARCDSCIYNSKTQRTRRSSSAAALYCCRIAIYDHLGFAAARVLIGRTEESVSETDTSRTMVFANTAASCKVRGFAERRHTATHHSLAIHATHRQLLFLTHCLRYQLFLDY